MNAAHSQYCNCQCPIADSKITRTLYAVLAANVRLVKNTIECEDCAEILRSVHECIDDKRKAETNA